MTAAEIVVLQELVEVTLNLPDVHVPCGASRDAEALVVSTDGRSPENTEIGGPPTPSDNVPSPMPIGRRDGCWDWRTS